VARLSFIRNGIGFIGFKQDLFHVIGDGGLKTIEDAPARQPLFYCTNADREQAR